MGMAGWKKRGVGCNGGRRRKEKGEMAGFREGVKASRAGTKAGRIGEAGRENSLRKEGIKIRRDR